MFVANHYGSIHIKYKSNNNYAKFIHGYMSLVSQSINILDGDCLYAIISSLPNLRFDLSPHKVLIENLLKRVIPFIANCGCKELTRILYALPKIGILDFAHHQELVLAILKQLQELQTKYQNPQDIANTLHGLTLLLFAYNQIENTANIQNQLRSAITALLLKALDDKTWLSFNNLHKSQLWTVVSALNFKIIQIPEISNNSSAYNKLLGLYHSEMQLAVNALKPSTKQSSLTEPFVGYLNKYKFNPLKIGPYFLGLVTQSNGRTFAIELDSIFHSRAEVMSNGDIQVKPVLLDQLRDEIIRKKEKVLTLRLPNIVVHNTQTHILLGNVFDAKDEDEFNAALTNLTSLL